MALEAKQIARTCRDNGTKLVIVSGSRAEGTSRSASDIDLDKLREAIVAIFEDVREFITQVSRKHVG